MSTLREAAQQALEALWHYHATEWGADSPASKAINALQAALTAAVHYGCHVDLEPSMEPDGCVLDEGQPERCIYAKRLLREGKDKTACEYWKPIEVKK